MQHAKVSFAAMAAVADGSPGRRKMTDSAVSEVSSPRPEPARDFDGLYKALLEAHPREALRLLCGARLDGLAVVLDGPTEQPRQRSRQRDKVFLVRHSEGAPADIYHVEVQVQRTEDFQERMVAYWAALALKYRRAEHRIHQVVLWPLGGGYPGRFHRDQARLDYRSVNVPDDLDPDILLAGPLAPLALWTQNPPHDLAERVADRIAATVALEEQLVQIELGMLVGGSLAAQVLEALRRRGMSNVLEQTESGREIARRSLEQGLEQGRVDGMRALLRAKYGDLDDLDDLARKLAERDHDANIARIVSGATLTDLRS
jgi:predicted transposase YdaD